MAPRHWLRARVVVIACLGNNDCADGQDDRSSGLLLTGGIRVLRNNVALLPGVSVLGVDDVIHCKGNLGPAKIAYDKQMRSRAGERARDFVRSEERRVGKECVSTCRSRWSPYH